MAWKKNLTQQQKAAYKEQKREEMDELFRRIDEGVKSVFQSDKYREYLRIMSKFTHYSARNCLLMLEQRKRGLFRRFRDYDRASKFYALLWYSYGYMMKAFGNKPHSMWSHFPLIDQAAERLQSVVVENRDFADLVRIYDRPDSFFYCDPPYYRSEYFYKSGAPVTDCFSTVDHWRFRDAMMRCEGKFLISYNDCPEVRELWDMPGIYIQKISRPHNLMLRYQLGEKYKELFISNYDTRERQRTFQQLSLLDE